MSPSSASEVITNGYRVGLLLILYEIAPMHGLDGVLFSIGFVLCLAFSGFGFLRVLVRWSEERDSSELPS
ncbi:hypothetical protein [Haloprofundus salinisoli]|uniref:hypothetical protein n=1 Tax=Haloprofundus salinisoli TaxID=2876193 RepID=UPI001CCA6610|nr:hypothetical protein [Haloprofundus salinisoli]